MTYQVTNQAGINGQLSWLIRTYMNICCLPQDMNKRYRKLRHDLATYRFLTLDLSFQAC